MSEQGRHRLLIGLCLAVLVLAGYFVYRTAVAPRETVRSVPLNKSPARRPRAF